MARPKRPVTPLADLASLIWRVPLYALPFAAFFVLVQGAPMSQAKGFYLVSLIFTFFTTLSIWCTAHFIAPRIEAWRENDPLKVVQVSGTYLLMSVVGVMAAAVVLNFTLIPGFISGMRGVLLILVYSLLFGALFLGLSLAVNFHRAAMERAGSERELQLARRIQRSFLLSQFPSRPRVEVFATNVSSKEASGDFYDVVTPDDDTLLLAVADVSGKGVPAALLASMLQASLRTQAGTVSSPAAMLDSCNRLACQRNSTGQFATFFLASLHEPTLTLRFTNGGHNFPVLLRADGTRVLLEKGGLVVGMLEGMPYEEESLVLAEGDRLVIYTDGVTEAANATGEMFEEERLYALLESAPRGLSAEQLVQRVIGGVRDFLGETEAGDDITVLALRVLPAARP
ncbi:MAG: serine/threonine-protein phosphatase [Candidatus Eisenbacteria bacterium]|nr:serine/threonine-protein phosphatase [Candidatus Eisenbacteria bacterium]